MNGMEQPNHPAFPQPDDPSTVLWRYMNADRFEWLVTNRRLFMSRPDQLGDSLEGTTPGGHVEWWRREAKNAGSEEQRQIIEHNRAFLARMALGFRSHYYVSCWHMNRHENYAMWRCYTSQPDAVSIRTTYATLRESLPNYVEMGIVRYIDYATERLPTMNMFEYIMHKDTYYGFECEARAVAFPPVGAEHFRENHYELEATPGVLVYAPTVNVLRLIHGVVLHPEAAPDYEQEIIKICAAHGLPRPERSRRTIEPVF